MTALVRSPGSTRSNALLRLGLLEVLQELLAPSKVVFFDKHWHFLGDKWDWKVRIASITGIDPLMVSSPTLIMSYGVAARMSWAANRKTTRPEDVAYSLLGIFGINMPLLYGESEKAFVRLQEEIIRINPDEPIFAWDFVSELNDSSIALPCEGEQLLYSVQCLLVSFDTAVTCDNACHKISPLIPTDITPQLLCTRAYWRMRSVSMATFLVPPELAFAAKTKRIHVHLKYQDSGTVDPEHHSNRRMMSRRLCLWVLIVHLYSYSTGGQKGILRHPF